MGGALSGLGEGLVECLFLLNSAHSNQAEQQSCITHLRDQLEVQNLQLSTLQSQKVQHQAELTDSFHKSSVHQQVMGEVKRLQSELEKTCSDGALESVDSDFSNSSQEAPLPTSALGSAEVCQLQSRLTNYWESMDDPDLQVEVKSMNLFTPTSS